MDTTKLPKEKWQLRCMKREVMEKIGMRREAHFRKCIPAYFKKETDEWWDEYFYAILNEKERCGISIVKRGWPD